MSTIPSASVANYSKFHLLVLLFDLLNCFLPENEDLVLLFGFVAVIGENPAHYNRPIVTGNEMIINYVIVPSEGKIVQYILFNKTT